jgi:hypothetical protein
MWPATTGNEREEAEVDLFDHEGPWTEDAYLTLTHDGRVEVVDGTLLVGPGAGPQRLRVIERVRAAFAAALPAGLRVRGPVPLRLGTDCLLVPDLVVTAAPAEGAAEPSGEDDAGTVLDAAAALMVIEVVGSDHGATDRTFKPQLYARSRIPYSLLIDHDGPFAVAEMIIGGRYHEYAHGGERLQIEEPFALDLDLAAITAAEGSPAAAPVESPAEAGA